MKTKSQALLEKISSSLFPAGDFEDYSGPASYGKELTNSTVGAILGGALGLGAGAGIGAGASYAKGLKYIKPSAIKRLFGAKPVLKATAAEADVLPAAIIGGLGGLGLGTIAGHVGGIRDNDRAYNVEPSGAGELTARSLISALGGTAALGLTGAALHKYNKPVLSKSQKISDAITKVFRESATETPTFHEIASAKKLTQNVRGALGAGLLGTIGSDMGIRGAMAKPLNETN